jgi:hypothetical protein
LEADEHTKKIEALQEANLKVTEASTLRAAHKGGVAAEIKKADAALESAISLMQQAIEEVKKKENGSTRTYHCVRNYLTTAVCVLWSHHGAHKFCHILAIFDYTASWLSAQRKALSGLFEY